MPIRYCTMYNLYNTLFKRAHWFNRVSLPFVRIKFGVFDVNLFARERECSKLLFFLFSLCATTWIPQLGESLLRSGRLKSIKKWQTIYCFKLKLEKEKKKKDAYVGQSTESRFSNICLFPHRRTHRLLITKIDVKVLQLWIF